MTNTREQILTENEAFTNQVILPHNLPPLEDQQFMLLESKYKRLKLIGSTLTVVLALLAFLGYAFLISDKTPLLILIGLPIVLALLFVWRLVLINLGFPKKGYLLREKDISYRTGLLFYKLTTIPFNRIQHVEISQNLLEKAVGLSRIKIYTAGGSVSDLVIPGLLPDKAQQIEAFLLNKISTHE